MITSAWMTSLMAGQLCGGEPALCKPPPALVWAMPARRRPDRTRAKNEAILDAASDVISSRGLSAPLDEIARRAGVSKQTIYNHYGSKVEPDAGADRARSQTITAPLDVPGAAANPEAALAAFAEVLLRPSASNGASRWCGC